MPFLPEILGFWVMVSKVKMNLKQSNKLLIWSRGRKRRVFKLWRAEQASSNPLFQFWQKVDSLSGGISPPPAPGLSNFNLPFGFQIPLSSYRVEMLIVDQCISPFGAKSRCSWIGRLLKIISRNFLIVPLAGVYLPSTYVLVTTWIIYSLCSPRLNRRLHFYQT